MRSPSCTRGSTLAAVSSRRWLLIAALAATLAALASTAGAAAKAQRLQAFGSCSRFVHYARRHASSELVTRGVPVGVPLPVRAPAPGNTSGPVVPQADSGPSIGGAGQDFSTTNVQEAGVDEP